MNTLSSFSPSSSSSRMDIDVSMFMDTSQEFESSQGDVVRWVASQSTNPALQALMREAERDRRTRPSTPVHEPISWTYPLSSMTSSTSLSTSVSSALHSSGHSSTDASYPPPLSGSSSSASSFSAPRASESSASRRAKPLPTAQRRPLASSTSSANQPSRHSTIPRSSSHSTLSNPSTSKEKYTPRDDEPEALSFIDLLKQGSKQVDENSKMKQQMARAKGKGKKREESLESGTDDHTDTGFDINHNLNPRTLTKTTSASAVCQVNSSTRAPEKTLTTPRSAYKPEPRGRTLAKEPNLGVPDVDPMSGKSTSTLLPSSNLKRDPKSAHRQPARVLNAVNANHATARKTSSAESVSNDGDSMMQDVIDLTETDTEWEKPISGPISRADTTMRMDLDDEESDTEMDVSFYKPEPPPRTRAPAPKPKPQPPQSTLPPAATQRTRTGPPPLGMRRAPQLQPSQYGSTQASRGVTVPRFKPPLFANAGGSTNKNGSGSKATSSRPSLRGSATKVPVAEAPQETPRDPDSSFDVSFGVDADALEEAMKAYD